MSIAENVMIARQLHQVAAGRTIVRATVNQNPHKFVWFATEPAQGWNCHLEGYEQLLTGQRIERAYAALGEYETFSCMLIAGCVLMANIPTAYHAAGAKRPKRHQLLLELDDGAAVSMCGSLGGPIFLFRANGKGEAADWGKPDFPFPISEEFTLERFLKLVRDTEFKSLTAKSFLATKNRIPGLDNRILQEILWEAKVNPKTKLIFLTQEDFVRIYHAVKKVFSSVIEAGGKDTDKDLVGRLGGYQTHVSRNTRNTPCPRCGQTVVKEAYLGGVVYYCPA